jgi:hypothetical protein
MKTSETVLFYLLLLGCAFPALGQGDRQTVIEKKETFRLSGDLPQLGNDDTLVLTLWPHLFYNAVPSSPQTTQKIVANRGHFQFSLTAPENPFYFSLYQLKKENGDLVRLDLLSYYIGECGDAILVGEKEGQLYFTGAGARKISIQYAINKLDTAFRLAYTKKRGPSKKWNDDALPEKMKGFSLPLLKEKMTLLNKHRSVLSGEVWGMLKADLVAENIQGRLFFLGNGITGPPERLKKYLGYCNDFVDALLKESIPEVAKARSRLYAPILLGHELLEARLKKTAVKGIEFYQAVTKGHKGELLDRLRTELILKYYPMFSHSEEYMQKGLKEVTTSYCKSALLKLFAHSQKGKRIYDFPLYDSASNLFYFSKLKGKIVFVDLWYIGCAGCYSFYQNSLKKVEEHFKSQKDIVFVSICAEVNRRKWMNTVRSGNYSSAGMINLTAGGFDSPLQRHYNVHSYPFQILLDREGKVCRINDLQKKPEELIEILNSYLQP